MFHLIYFIVALIFHICHAFFMSQYFNIIIFLSLDILRNIIIFMAYLCYASEIYFSLGCFLLLHACDRIGRQIAI